MCLRHVGSDKKKQPCILEFAEGVGHRAGAEGGCQTGNRRGVSSSRTVINIVRTNRAPEKFLHIIRIFVDASRTADSGNGIRA